MVKCGGGGRDGGMGKNNGTGNKEAGRGGRRRGGGAMMHYQRTEHGRRLFGLRWLLAGCCWGENIYLDEGAGGRLLDGGVFTRRGRGRRHQ